MTLSLTRCSAYLRTNGRFAWVACEFLVLPALPFLALSIPRYTRTTSVCRDGNAPDNSISRFRTRESESKTDEINLLPLVKPAGVFKLNYASPGSPIRFHARRKRIFTNVPEHTVCIIAGGARVDGVWRLGYLEVADLSAKRNPDIYNVLFLAKFVITALYFGFISFLLSFFFLIYLISKPILETYLFLESNLFFSN